MKNVNLLHLPGVSSMMERLINRDFINAAHVKRIRRATRHVSGWTRCIQPRFLNRVNRWYFPGIAKLHFPRFLILITPYSAWRVSAAPRPRRRRTPGRGSIWKHTVVSNERSYRAVYEGAGGREWMEWKRGNLARDGRREITYERLGGARRRSNPPPFRHCPTYGFTHTFPPRVRSSRGILPGRDLAGFDPRILAKSWVTIAPTRRRAFSNARTTAYSRRNTRVVTKT